MYKRQVVPSARARASISSTRARIERRVYANASSASAPMSPNSVHHHQAFVPEFTTTSGSTVTPRAASSGSASGRTGRLAASTTQRAVIRPWFPASIAYETAAGTSTSASADSQASPGRSRSPGRSAERSTVPWASRAASSASTSRPAGLAIVPLMSATATIVSPARVRKRAVAPPMVPNPWRATRVPAYGRPARSRAVRAASATPQPPTNSSRPMPSTSTANASASRRRASDSSSSSGYTAWIEETSPASAAARSTRS